MGKKDVKCQAEATETRTLAGTNKNTDMMLRIDSSHENSNLGASAFGSVCSQNQINDAGSSDDTLVARNNTNRTEDRNKWSCLHCTFLNHADLPYCEMCSSAKNSTPSASESACLPGYNNQTGVTSEPSVNNYVVEKNSSSDDTHNKEVHERMYIRERNVVSPHEMSCSEDDTTETDYEAPDDLEDYTAVKDRSNNSECFNGSESPSIQSFSETSQSDRPNTSTDSLIIGNYSDTEEETPGNEEKTPNKRMKSKDGGT